jgi:hypothetical protein
MVLWGFKMGRRNRISLILVLKIKSLYPQHLHFSLGSNNICKIQISIIILANLISLRLSMFQLSQKIHGQSKFNPFTWMAYI